MILTLYGCTSPFGARPTPTSTRIPAPVVTQLPGYTIVTYPDFPNAFHNQLEMDDPQAFDESQRQGMLEYAQTIAHYYNQYSTDAIEFHGPESAGGIIVINRRQIKLPSDAYIVILHKREFATDRCMIQGMPCPDLPYYILAKNDAVIHIEQNSGKIYSTSYANLDEALHDFAEFQFLFDALETLETLPTAPRSPLTTPTPLAPMSPLSPLK